MDQFHSFLKPKLQNLINFVKSNLESLQTKELQETGKSEIDDELIGAITNRYVALRDDPIILVQMCQQFLFKHFDREAKKLDTEAVKAEFEKAKKEAFKIASIQPDFDPVKFEKIVGYKLPAFIEERVFQYLHMFCDVGCTFGVDKL